MSRHKNVSSRRRALLASRKRSERFTAAIERLYGIEKIFNPDPKSELAVEVQHANFAAERPALFQSRYVRDRKHAALLARPRAERKPRPRLERRRLARVAAKAARKAASR